MQKMYVIGCLLWAVMLIPGAGHAQDDMQAREIASAVIDAMGGAEKWNDIRTVRWTFFNSRQWWWDKWTGDVRMESQRDDLRIGMNIHTMQGTVFVHGAVQTATDSLSKYLDLGYRMWINDSYWFIMPFKLKDPGVNLRYLGEQMNKDSIPCQVVELTFDNVGVTPDNKYHVYVDDKDLVVQWDYYRYATNTEPNFSTIWGDYHDYNGVLLSARRGDGSMGDIAVFGKLPDAMFTDVSRPADALLR